MTFVLPEPKPSRPRWQRVPLAFIQAISTLIGQFRLPLLMFILVTIVGGYFYGELHEITRDSIAIIDRPYVMLQLMILSPPADYESTPSEWYLVMFWYILPLVFVFIIGNGVADFVRLFFGDTWNKIRISNYQNHIIVLGAGHVGLQVVHWLREWGEQVVVVDNDLHPGKRGILQDLKVKVIAGDARHQQTLEDANIADAAAFIACTGDDAVNLYSIMRARAENPDVQMVVRVWDDSFSEQIEEFIVHSHQSSFANGKENVLTGVLSSSEIAAPIFAGLALGIELTQTLNIGNVEYGAVRLTIKEGSSFANKTVGQIQSENQVDIVLHQSSLGSFGVRPPHNLTVKAGDSLVIFAEHQACIDIARQNKPDDDTGHIVVLGVGHVGLRVVRWLLSWNIPIVVVDNNIELDVRFALESMQNADHALKIIEADGRDQYTLEQAGIRDASAFVACTGDDPINLYAIMRARALNPDMQIVIRVWDDSFNEQIEQFIIRQANGQTHSQITSVRSSSNLAAPIFSSRSLGIDLTQTLEVYSPQKGITYNYVAVRIEVEHDSFLANLTLNEIQSRAYLQDKSVDIVVYCSGEGQPQLLPEKNIRVQAGDTLVIFAELDVCIDIAKRNQRRKR